MSKRVLVVASTFPSSDTDSVPAFVKDQVIAMKRLSPETEFSVLAPHDAHSNTSSLAVHEHYNEHRFHYFWPFSLEKLTGRGIMPAIKANKLNYLLIPFLFTGEFIALLILTLRLKPDYIYAHWFTPQAVTTRWVSLLTDRPFVFTTHAADVDVWRKIPFVGNALVRSHAKRSAAITAVSRRSLDKLRHFFSDSQWLDIADKTAVIPMGVDVDTNSPDIDADTLKDKYNLQGKNVLFFMGRLAEKKGVSYLLEAMSKVEADANLQLVIAGDGPLRSSLEQQARRLDIESRINFVGYLSGTEKRDYLRLADFMILPSIITRDGDAEGLPVTFMEGLAAGKICIATNESGADDIIEHTRSGYLIPHKDTSAIVKAINWSLSLDSQTKQSIRNEARQVAQQFDWSTIAQRHLDFFDLHLR